MVLLRPLAASEGFFLHRTRNIEVRKQRVFIDSR